MIYVVERYLPGLSRADLLPRLSRLEAVIEELRGEGSAVLYLGSAIVLEDEACFCQFEGSSAAAVVEANRRADLPFDRIVPAVLVQPTHRSGEMPVLTSIPKSADRRRSHALAAIVAAVAVVVLASWAIATRAAHSGARSTRSSAPTEASVLRSLTPAGREYMLAISSMPPGEQAAAFNTSDPLVSGRNRGGSAQRTRSRAPSLAAVLRSLTPRQRQYVLGIASLTPLQLWAAFGTTPTPPVSGHRRGIARSSAAESPALALPILPTCGPGSCWRGVTSPGRQR